MIDPACSCRQKICLRDAHGYKFNPRASKTKPKTKSYLREVLETRNLKAAKDTRIAELKAELAIFAAPAPSLPQ